MRITVGTLVNAPVESVWRAYTTPEDIVQWNAASDDWHTTRATADLRPCGAFCSRMVGHDPLIRLERPRSPCAPDGFTG